jgi:hypothetical protein
MRFQTMDRDQHPDRRRFLALGGATVAFSAIAVACGSGSSDEALPFTGTVPPPGRSIPPARGREEDITLLRTAQSIEALAVEVYQQVLAGDLLTDSTATRMARLFEGQHAENIPVVGDLVSSAGGDPHPQPNPYLWETVFAPALEAAAAEADVLTQLLAMEATCSQNAAFANELLSTAELRQSLTAVGSPSARRSSVLLELQSLPPVPFAVLPVAARAPADAYLPEA